MSRRVLTVTTLAAAAAAGLCSCGGGSKSSSSSSAPASTQAQTGPASHVAFMRPVNGGTTGSTFTAKVKLAHFKIAPNAVGQAPKPGEGHLHFQFDKGRFDYPKYSGPNGKLAKSLGVAGRYSPALTPTITYSHIPPGRHTLTVMLANNNHTPTGTSATVHFSVR